MITMDRNNMDYNLDDLPDFEESDNENVEISNLSNNVEKRNELMIKLNRKLFLENDKDFKELQDVIDDIDKEHAIKLEKDIDLVQILDTKISDLKEHNAYLKRFKQNYSKTINKLPIKFIKEKITENSCSICLEDKTKIGENFIITTCFHVFHEECLKKSIMQNNSKCPLCRFELKQSFNKIVQININCKDVCSFN